MNRKLPAANAAISDVATHPEPVICCNQCDPLSTPKIRSPSDTMSLIPLMATVVSAKTLIEVMNSFYHIYRPISQQQHQDLLELAHIQHLASAIHCCHSKHPFLLHFLLKQLFSRYLIVINYIPF
jgi:hypothetical protein